MLYIKTHNSISTMNHNTMESGSLPAIFVQMITCDIDMRTK